ncbi:MAG: M20/M25/M40 family metallo-hydrolase [Erythrobacter sp.]
MIGRILASTAALALAVPAGAQMAITPMGALRPDQQQFFELYKELVETDTTASNGSCTQASAQLAARLEAAGVPRSDITLFSVPEHPKEGGIVVVWPGKSKLLKPMLLLGHIDVVEAKREDWVREPFKLIEEDGYYYARGTVDDKFMSAVWADTILRFAQDGYHPKRTVKIALTCGEETDTAFNGAQYLSTHMRELIDAEFALNEGGGGRSDGKGNLLVQTIQVGEKVYQDYRLVATNPGGHSSQPVRDNAIYRMSAALSKIGAYEFPAEFNDTTRAFFAKASAMRPDETGKAMAALVANIDDAGAMAIVNRDKMLHSLLRTTCVATLIDGGHAPNALPQRVEANVNCRIFPGHAPAEIKDALARVVGDDGIAITLARTDKPLAVNPPLDPRLLGPVERLAAKHFPGVPVLPAMSTGATDGVYTGGAGIPTYGVPGAWGDPDGNGAHGLNERIQIRAVYAGRDYLYDLVKTLAL